MRSFRAMQQTTSEDTTPFTIGDVLGEAWRSFRRRFATHAGFNVAFLAALILSICLVGCAMVPVFMAIGVGAAGAGGPDQFPQGPMLIVIVVIYAVMTAVYLALMSLHQGFTLALTAADLRG